VHRLVVEQAARQPTELDVWILVTVTRTDINVLDLRVIRAAFPRGLAAGPAGQG
jgi:hypothetical protein